MPFTPPVYPPIPLLDACVYAALGDLIPGAQASADVRLAVAFSAGSIIGTLTAAERTLARLTFDPPAFHEALLTIATALEQVGGHQVSALEQRFQLDAANEERAVDGARLTVLWPPRAADAAPPLTLIAHACANEGSLAVVVHLTPDAAQALISTGASFLADLTEAADLIQSAAGLSRALAALRRVSARATAR